MRVAHSYCNILLMWQPRIEMSVTNFEHTSKINALVNVQMSEYLRSTFELCTLQNLSATT